MAEAYLKSLKLPGVNVISSGTVADKYRKENEPKMEKITRLLADKGLGSFAKKRADQLTQQRMDQADINICMNKIVKAEADQIVKMPTGTIVWDVLDSSEGYRVIKPGDDPYKYTEEIYQEIKTEIDNLVQRTGLH
jgi:protein-tyrosine-phosphatase